MRGKNKQKKCEKVRNAFPPWCVRAGVCLCVCACADIDTYNVPLNGSICVHENVLQYHRGQRTQHHRDAGLVENERAPRGDEPYRQKGWPLRKAGQNRARYHPSPGSSKERGSAGKGTGQPLQLHKREQGLGAKNIVAAVHKLQ